MIDDEDIEERTGDFTTNFTAIFGWFAPIVILLMGIGIVERYWNFLNGV